MSNDSLNLTVAVRLPAAAAASDERDTIPWFDGPLEEDAAPTTRPPPPPIARAPRPRTGVRLRDEGEIARGGMGSIRRIYDTELRRYLARKVIEPTLGADPASAQRFIDEARITGMLDHPNIVPVHDLVTDDRASASYTMKLVEGQTLTALIAAQKTRRDLEHILACLIKVCDALSFAHSRGVIHRDLKPDNIMVGSYGQVYVMDWGLAQVIGDRSLIDGDGEPDGMVVGTIQFMAPEQARGLVSQIDARTDVFALGAVLYKVLTGVCPYPGPITVALPAAQRAEFRPPDQAWGVRIKPPPHLSEIVMKAMAREPADRYQSAEEFAEAVRQFLRGGNWFPMHTFAAGAVIVQEGDRADAAYIIVAGRCEVRKRDPQDPTRSQTLRVLEAGEVFGETAIFADAPRSATVIALEDVRAVVVERTALEGLVASSWLGQFVKALADRFLDVDARLARATSREA